jgi:hypothetical protein
MLINCREREYELINDGRAEIPNVHDESKMWKDAHYNGKN